MPTATTYLKSHKRADKRTALQSLKDRFDYGLNPEKLGAVSSYLCDPATAHAEFMLVKNQYQGETDRMAGHGALCYQIRQAFPHGEVTPEEANRIGYETAMRWTKGKYQFFVCTHIDKEHIHNHIYYNSTAYDRSRKFRNFIGSSFALRRLSDRVCLEHDLSVIVNPKLHSKGRYLHYGQYLKEHQLFEYNDLAAKTDAATERFHTLAGDIQQTEAELSRVSDLMAAVVQYAKTRPAFDGYKAAKYSRKYLAEHEAELADYRAAKATMAELLGGEKLLKMDVLKEKRRQLAARKKALYLEYRKAQQDMRELVAVKGSVDHLRGLTDSQRNKEQAR